MMTEKLNTAEEKMVLDYIDKIDEGIRVFNSGFSSNTGLTDILLEVVNVFSTKIPQLKDALCFKITTEVNDATTARALLIMYLAGHGIEFKGKNNEENASVKRFWSSFITWFENELPELGLLQEKYLEWDNWDGGMWRLNINYDYEFQLYRGINYPGSLKHNTANFDDIKTFLEIAYKYWIKNEGQKHYQFTIEVNERFRIFKLPYRMQNGTILKQGYKTTYGIDKIINYRMFERKIRFSENMINSHDLMEKKSALDLIIDALQYIVSIQDGKGKDKKYAALASSVNSGQDTKVYAVIKQEIKDLMKLSNEYFDIRHNDYLNDAREKREPLNDSQFIEYLYNRAYALLYLLRLKAKINDGIGDSSPV